MIAQTIQNKPMRDGRQESFCQWMARANVSITQAYRNAGYEAKNAGNCGSKLAKLISIKTRIAQIKAIKERKVVVTPQSVAIEADDNYHLALAMGDIKAANAALVIKARAYGCQTDKTVTEHTDAQQARTAAERREDKRYAQWVLTQPQEASNDDMANTDKVELDSQERAGTKHETQPGDSGAE